MEELELTYLAKYIPENLASSPHKKIVDIYIPIIEGHPKTRIRRSGEKFEITKKQPLVENDSSHQIEDTIALTKKEYEALIQIPGKRVSKVRYYLNREGINYEIDIFNEGLYGLVLVDVEFNTIAEKNAFQKPDFCLVDVTQEEFVAGGLLAGEGVLGKNYKEVETHLSKFGYKKLEYKFL